MKEGLVSSDRVNAALAEILDAAARVARDTPGQERPLFLFAQYFDAHSASSEFSQNTLPYYSPPAYRDDGLSDPDREFCDPVRGCASGFLAAADVADRAVAAATLTRVRALYDRSVRHLDAQLGQFLQDLRHRGLYDDALIVVTGDHGEEFREHGRLLHSQTYDETAAIPLLVKLPAAMEAGAAGEAVEAGFPRCGRGAQRRVGVVPTSMRARMTGGRV